MTKWNASPAASVSGSYGARPKTVGTGSPGVASDSEMLEILDPLDTFRDEVDGVYRAEDTLETELSESYDVCPDRLWNGTCSELVEKGESTV